MEHFLDRWYESAIFARANGSWIRSTLLDKNRLYVMGMQETLVCLDAGLEIILWKLSAPKALQTPDPSFGGVSSPLIEGMPSMFKLGWSDQG